jgi:hypothetical protein
MCPTQRELDHTPRQAGLQHPGAATTLTQAAMPLLSLPTRARCTVTAAPGVARPRLTWSWALGVLLPLVLSASTPGASTSCGRPGRLGAGGLACSRSGGISSGGSASGRWGTSPAASGAGTHAPARLVKVLGRQMHQQVALPVAHLARLCSCLPAGCACGGASLTLLGGAHHQRVGLFAAGVGQHHLHHTTAHEQSGGRGRPAPGTCVQGWLRGRGV